MVKQVKHIDDTALCFSRKKYGRGFQFFNEKGDKITDKKMLRRLKKLVIPPMWSEVMICKWEDGHIQATGRDLKGRKQYIYHSEWERQRQQEKFDKMKSFGARLPDIRQKCLADIRVKRWNRNKVLALITLILDDSGIRIGNRQYAERNNTYGLTTLRRKHIHIEDDVLTFEYKGKSNKTRTVEIEDEDLIRFIKTSSELPGYEIFRYKDGANNWQSVDSDEVNAYIRSVIGEDYSSKDFRTWVASRLAVEYYPQALEQTKETPRKKFSNILIRMVADELGNTPSVCKNYYVHPKILQQIDQQNLPIVTNTDTSFSEYELCEAEEIVLKVIS